MNILRFGLTAGAHAGPSLERVRGTDSSRHCVIDRRKIRQRLTLRQTVIAAAHSRSYCLCRADLIDLPGFTHRSFSDLPLLAAGNDRGKWDEALRNFQIARAFTHGFFDKYLKADKQTVLDAKSPPDERVKVDRFGPAAKAEASRSTSP